MSDNPLFAPIAVNGLTLRNRIVLPSMVTGYAAPNGEVGERLVRHHAERAAGGCGLNMLEAAYVADSGNSFARGVGISHDIHLPGLARLAEAVHAHDGRIGAQLQHGGRAAHPSASGGPRLLVSYVPGLTPYEDSRVLDASDIAALVDAYAAAAGRAVRAGFDAVELHGAHGYLLNQFLSPLTNRREDDYGGGFTQRMRFPLEVLRAVRSEVGSAYPVLFRLSVEEFLPGGLDLPQALDIAAALADAGVDALHVSVGVAETNHFTIPPSRVEPGWNGQRAAAVKRATGGRIPVIVAGRVNGRSAAEAILASGQADLVAMGRALLADPGLPQQLASGLDETVIPCVACNEGCAGGLARGEAVSCAVNPRTGLEGRYPLIRAASRKRVLVAGGGPGGMQAALTAARRGHEVVLLERSGRLGGLLRAAMRPPHKEAYGDLIRYYARALVRAGVDVRLDTEATPPTVTDMAPDVVLAAVGGEPLLPAFCRDVPVTPAAAALEGATVGRRVLILGGGLVGCETAEFLAERGHEVTILERRGELAPDMEDRTRRLLLPRLRETGVTALLDTEVLALAPDGAATVRDESGERVLTGFDTLLAALGYRPRRRAVAALRATGLPVLALGDCLQPGKVMHAVSQAHRAAYDL